MAFMLVSSWDCTYAITDGAQVVLSKCIRRADQDWSKYSYTKASMHFLGSVKPTLEAESLPLREEQKHYQLRKQTFLENM